MKNISFDLIIISNPTSCHIEYCKIFYEFTNNFLIEKPLTNDFNKDYLFLKKLFKNKNIFIGYMLHFNPLISKLKNIINSNNFGELIYYRSYWGEDLTKWHKNEDYKKSYAALKLLGGGSDLTLSHDIELFLYLFNVQSKIKFNKIKVINPSLETTADNICEYIFKYKNSIVNIHLNYFDQNYRKLDIKSSNFDISLDIINSKLIIKSSKSKRIFHNKYFKRNDMFINEIKYILKNLNKKIENKFSYYKNLHTFIE